MHGRISAAWPASSFEGRLGSASNLRPIAMKSAFPVAMAASPTSGRSEEHTSELQSLMRISYAVFCLKKKTTAQNQMHQGSANIKKTQCQTTSKYIHHQYKHNYATNKEHKR